MHGNRKHRVRKRAGRRAARESLRACSQLGLTSCVESAGALGLGRQLDTRV